MIDKWRHFCYNVNLILSPKKAWQTLMNIKENVPKPNQFLQYAINQTVWV